MENLSASPDAIERNAVGNHGDPTGVLDVLEAEYKSALGQYSDNAQDIEENMRLLLTSNQSPQNMR